MTTKINIFVYNEETGISHKAGVLLTREKSVTKYIFSKMRTDSKFANLLKLEESQYVSDIGLDSLTTTNSSGLTISKGFNANVATIADSEGFQWGKNHIKIRDLNTMKETELPVRIGVVAYPIGYVLCVNGRFLSSLGMTKASMTYYPSDAKIFSTVKSMHKFLTEKETLLKLYCEQNLWAVSWMTVNDMFEREERDRLKCAAEKVRNEYSSFCSQIDEIIKDLNAVSDDSTPKIPESFENISEEEKKAAMKKEAEYRIFGMLRIMPALKEGYRKNDILYFDHGHYKETLSEEAEAAINEAKHFGVTPYMVFHDTLQFKGMPVMDSYSVLFVSDYPEEWEYERMDSSNNIYAYVHSNIDSEFGTINVCLTSHGGIRRSY